MAAAGEMRQKLPFSMIIAGRSTYLLLGLLALLCAYPLVLDATWQHRLLLGSLNVAILIAAARAATQTHRTFLLTVVFWRCLQSGCRRRIFLRTARPSAICFF
jgi:hypothetical protein